MVVVPYVPCIETFKTHLPKFNTNLVFRYSNKLKTQLNHTKPPSTKQSVVYKIDCQSCEKSYIGETTRDLDIQVKEHQYDMETCKPECGIVTTIMKLATTVVCGSNLGPLMTS